MNFTKYQHVERLGTTETDGILDGDVLVFPKIDGTNCSVWLGDDGDVHCSNRNMEHYEATLGARAIIEGIDLKE